MNSGTGTDPSTDRCGDCGHLLDVECGCSCCGAWSPEYQRAEDAKHAGEQWPPGNGWPRWGHYWLRESDGVTVCQICGAVR